MRGCRRVNRVRGIEKGLQWMSQRWMEGELLGSWVSGRAVRVRERKRESNNKKVRVCRRVRKGLR